MIARSKKHQQDKESSGKHYNHGEKHQDSSKSSLAVTRRKAETNNKENFIQITEPLDTAALLSQSKQFVLSRDSLSTNGRAKLKDISNTTNNLKSDYSRQLSAKKQTQKQQQLFDRRLSLKCTGNHSQQIQNQKSQRFSMAPLRRESFSTQLNAPINLLEEKESTSSFYHNSVASSQPKNRQTMKKQVIITNLMNKLDHQEDLRSIIELKLKTGSNSTQLHRQKRNQSYMTDYTEEANNQSMAAKLRQCESEITYFKEIIKQMSEKIIELTDQKKFGKKPTNLIVHSASKPSQNSSQIFEIMRKAIDLGCSKCKNCQCRLGQAEKSVKNARFQNSETKVSRSQPKVNESFDFLDNLEQTLKVLDCKKN